MAKKVSLGVVHNLPSDLKKALVSHPKALVTWGDITPLARKVRTVVRLAGLSFLESRL